MPKPILMLDVDGVLIPHGNITRPDQVHDHHHDDHHHVELDHDYFGPIVARFPLAKKQLLDQLEEHFDFIWLTYGWKGDYARHVEAAYQLPQLDEVDFPIKFSGGPMKHWGVQEFCAKHRRPFAWVDDSFIPPSWVRELQWDDIDNRPDVPHLLIVPDPEVGMTQEHVDKLIAWAGSLDV